MVLNISSQQSESVSTLEIFELDGKKIFSEKFNELQHKVNIASLSKGTYLLKMYSKTKTLTSKFIKR